MHEHHVRAMPLTVLCVLSITIDHEITEINREAIYCDGC